MGLSYIWVCATIRALVQISADIRTRHVDLAFQEIVDRLMNHILFSQVVSESSRLQYIRTCPCGLLGKDIIFGAKCMVADETIHAWLPLKGQGYSAKEVLTMYEDMSSRS
ncbi:hypothetical protein DPMN_191520 [Dreissena polymorpha]|uniref:Uncharacterized protein n=1 Tax=Dreissena polymorpha TaxID=45954 RepID=A0A9D3XX32_DREPO|nr:hypothetical protein DPMN_191520 [Dreissena polymorpha]